MNISLRRASAEDLNLLESMEKSTFPFYQQSKRESLRHSLKSSFQQVWLAEFMSDGEVEVAGGLVLYFYKRSVRIYSIGVLHGFQHQGIGRLLLQKAEDAAQTAGFGKITLEADASNLKLIAWYKRAGFMVIERIPDYYEESKDAFKMMKELPGFVSAGKTTNIIVVNKPENWRLSVDGALVISAADYIAGRYNIGEIKARVFNLCNSYKYQSLGYYVSLLASARDQRAIPNVTTIRDYKNIDVIRSIADDMDAMVQKVLSHEKCDYFEINIYFGQCLEERLKPLARKLYQMFEAPLFQVQFIRMEKWLIKKIRPLSLSKIPEEEIVLVKKFASVYFSTKRFGKSRLKNYTYFMAVLVNPAEVNPPSNQLALKRLQEAAEKAGIYSEFITKDDYNKLCEYDALFIRETTGVDNHTYQFARKAYSEGLVVIDDPWSILRCSNKIFLNERLRHNNIKTPRTVVLNKDSDIGEMLTVMPFPIILKKPDSAFSLGVKKVNSTEQLKIMLEEFFKKSELVLAQEFIPTEYDWRIGVLDNKPLFACKYFMAKNHWQIYNWEGNHGEKEGNFATLPLEEVPPAVIKTALKASALIGDGLYGVDLKVHNGCVYVIEVNDNPNIDGGIEDKILGKTLYDRLIKSFITRIEVSRNIERLVSIAPD